MEKENNKESNLKIFMVVILPALLTIFIIFFILMPKIRENRDENKSPNNTPKTENIQWEEVAEILKSGNVKSVFQTHNLDERLELDNGNLLKTKEPQIDDIFKEIEKCGNVCDNITLATE